MSVVKNRHSDALAFDTARSSSTNPVPTTTGQSTRPLSLPRSCVYSLPLPLRHVQRPADTAQGPLPSFRSTHRQWSSQTPVARSLSVGQLFAASRPYSFRFISFACRCTRPNHPQASPQHRPKMLALPLRSIHLPPLLRNRVESRDCSVYCLKLERSLAGATCYVGVSPRCWFFGSSLGPLALSVRIHKAFDGSGRQNFGSAEI